MYLAIVNVAHVVPEIITTAVVLHTAPLQTEAQKSTLRCWNGNMDKNENSLKVGLFAFVLLHFNNWLSKLTLTPFLLTLSPPAAATHSAQMSSQFCPS